MQLPQHCIQIKDSPARTAKTRIITLTTAVATYVLYITEHSVMEEQAEVEGKVENAAKMEWECVCESVSFAFVVVLRAGSNQVLLVQQHVRHTQTFLYSF